MRERLGEQFAAALKDVFPFERPRCVALVDGLAGKVRLLGEPAIRAAATTS